MKICIGLSGGVDSSVAAYLLKQQGCDVFALFMQNWHDTAGTLHGECEWEEDRVIAEMVAKKIGIPFHFVDLSEVYRQRVVDYMFSEYEKGRTPNPDVLCNREIKFDAFLKAAQDLGADMVATGHYCRKESFVDASGKEVFRILAGSDPNKDQSYFLCQLSQEQLSKAMFPIGDICKPEVRRIAHEAGLPSADKKDSQGICFVGKVDLPVFLQQKLKQKEGDVVEIFREFYEVPCDGRSSCDAKDFSADLLPNITASSDCLASAALDKPVSDCLASAALDKPVSDCLNQDLASMAEPITYHREDGKVIGKHIGAQYYTIGQRKGLNIGGHAEPLFIIANDMEENIIYVGEGQSHPGLYRPALRILPEEIHWIRPDLEMAVGEERNYLVRIRYRQPLQKASLIMASEGLYIKFDEPQRGITPGQFAAWYAPDGEMIGSGVINR